GQAAGQRGGRGAGREAPACPPARSAGGPRRRAAQALRWGCPCRTTAGRRDLAKPGIRATPGSTDTAPGPRHRADQGKSADHQGAVNVMPEESVMTEAEWLSCSEPTPM